MTSLRNDSFFKIAVFGLVFCFMFFGIPATKDHACHPGDPDYTGNSSDAKPERTLDQANYQAAHDTKVAALEQENTRYSSELKTAKEAGATEDQINALKQKHTQNTDAIYQTYCSAVGKDPCPYLSTNRTTCNDSTG